MLKIGHRGAAGYEPENTLLSFSKAIELGAEMVEFDVQCASGGELVVIHDDSVDRTTNGKGFVSEIPFEELRALDAGKGQKIPTLKEVFDLCLDKVSVNIELKGDKTAVPVYALIKQYIEKGVPAEKFLVSSFNHYELWQGYNIDPSIRIGALILAVPPDFAAFAREMNAYSVHVALSAVSKEIVDELHEKEIKVFVYTVNDPEGAAQMRAIGVDGVFSGRPDKLS